MGNKKACELTSKILELYNNGKSLREIATEVSASLGTVYKVVKQSGNLRDKSEAQSLAISTGKREHPTAGKPRSESTKQKISESRAEAWDRATPEERKKASDRQREFMNNMDEKTKKEMSDKAMQGLLATKKEGSRIERFVRDELISRGFVVEFHRKHVVSSEQLEVDILLPELNIACEIDGIFHTLDIWGEERFLRGQERDNKKNGLLMSAGINVIRIITKSSTISIKYMNDVLNVILEQIEKLKNQRSQLIKIPVGVDEAELEKTLSKYKKRKKKNA